METEFDVKFYPVDKEVIRKKLKKLGAKQLVLERKMKRVIFDKIANPKIKGNYLRLRDEGNCVRLSIKVHAKKGGRVSDQKEAEVEVADFDRTLGILRGIGLKETNYQESLRESWEYQGVKIEIDTWPGLEPLVEVEGQSEEEIRRVAEKLGFNWENKIFTGVLQIFAKAYGLSDEATWEKLRYLTFGKIPFAGKKGRNNA